MERINIYAEGETISAIHISEDIGEVETLLDGYRHIFAVMDRSVAMECPSSLLLAEILNRKSVPGMLLDASEDRKTIGTVMEICSWLLEQGADRDALVLAVGGGITSDMVGFAASVYKRGVRFAYMPTTLLAQVDASIGGKTGVNFEKYKNILGTIRQPEFTFICPQVLVSLSNRDFLSGVAELLKTFIIEDNENYYDAVGLLSDMNVEYCSRISEGEDEFESWRECVEKYSSELLKLICEAAKVKAGVVSRDQFENGERRKLNLGHTFAHAIETLSQLRAEDITHGEAVAMGLVLAAELSEKYARVNPLWREIYDFGLHQRIEDDLHAVGLPINCPFRIGDMAQAMTKDKKVEDGKVRFVLPAAIGDVRIVELTVDEVVTLLS